MRTQRPHRHTATTATFTIATFPTVFALWPRNCTTTSICWMTTPTPTTTTTTKMIKEQCYRLCLQCTTTTSSSSSSFTYRICAHENTHNSLVCVSYRPFTILYITPQSVLKYVGCVSPALFRLAGFAPCTLDDACTVCLFLLRVLCDLCICHVSADRGTPYSPPSTDIINRSAYNYNVELV